jgi:phosphatidate cytidylyltransferase
LTTAPATAVATTDAPRSRELLLRVLSAAALVPVIILLLVLGGWPFNVLVAVVAAVSAYEICAMALRPLPPVAVVGVACSAILPLCAPLGPQVFTVLALLLFVCVLAGLQSVMWGTGDIATGVAGIPWPLFGLVYAALPLTLVAQLRGWAGGDWWVILLLSITWMNDTGAYFAGRAFGRHKLLARVSPKKTWEGFAGGMVGSLVAAFVVRAIGEDLNRWVSVIPSARGFPALTVPDCLFLGVAAAILGPSGDLAESLLKRAFGVKDSGKILPGHGGILDRIDALLFTAPLVYFFAIARGHG